VAEYGIHFKQDRLESGIQLVQVITLSW